jgi:hypothetical protein
MVHKRADTWELASGSGVTLDAGLELGDAERQVHDTYRTIVGRLDERVYFGLRLTMIFHSSPPPSSGLRGYRDLHEPGRPGRQRLPAPPSPT